MTWEMIAGRQQAMLPPTTPANLQSIRIDFAKPDEPARVALNLLPATVHGLRAPVAPRSNRQQVPAPAVAPIIAAQHSMINRRLVEKLAETAVYRQFRRAFEEATGLPLALRAVEGWRLAHSDRRCQNGFRALMYRTNRSRAACLEMQQRVCAGVNGSPCTLRYPFGIVETAVGVKIGREIVAYLQTGQVFLKPPTAQQTRCALKQIKEWGLAIRPDTAARRYRETPVVRRTEYRARVRLLQFFADQLGATANQILLLPQTAEPAQIRSAREFIEEHYQEKFTLGTVASRAGMCSFYFCKMFKKVTGVNFTRYVSGVRAERAKNLLLNRHYRISEIAFEVGFQSLTHFNRVFKTIAGRSPTEFRRQLPAFSNREINRRFLVQSTSPQTENKKYEK